MKRATVALSLLLLAAPHAGMAQDGGAPRGVAVCKSVNAAPDKAFLAGLSEDDLKEKMCLSSLSVVRSADQLAGMECRQAFKTLFSEFSRRHPGKEMAEVYGRC